MKTNRKETSRGDAEALSLAGTPHPAEKSPRLCASARKNWKRVKLENLGKFQSGGTPSRSNSEFFGGRIPWITTVALTGKSITATDAVDFLTEVAIEKSAAKIVPADSIMVGMRVGIGKTAINTVPMSTNQDIVSITGIDDEIWYKPYILKALAHFVPYFQSQARGATIKGIKVETLENVEIPFPPLEEQKKIAGTLDKVRELIELRERELAKLDELVKCRFVEMFGDVNTTEISRGDAEAQRLSGARSRRWKEEKIGSLCEIVSGATPKTEKMEYWNGNNFWITPAEISDEDFVIKKTERTLSDAGVRAAGLRLMPAGTVLLSSRAPIGKLAISGVPMYCNQGFKNLICGSRISNIFLLEWLRERRSYLISLGRGATFKEISKAIVEDISVPVPPMALQEEFARFAEQVEKSKFEVRKALEKLKICYKSLMQEYFG